jgi:hypothetical protein
MEIINLKSRGFTLLEVLLALLLATLVLMAVAMAIDVHLRVLNSGRADVEEAQLARALLGRIADDLRGAVQYDPAEMAKLASASAMSGAGGGSPAGSSSGGATGASGSGAGAGGTGGSGAGGTGGSGTGGSGGSGTGGSGGSGTGATGGAGTGGTGGSSGTTDASQGSTATSGLAASVVPPSIPGLYGNQYEMQVDVSRLPRIDQLAALMAAQSGEQLADRPSEVKTVTYYLQDNGAAGSLGAAGSANLSGGLVRRELDRFVTAWAAQQGSLSETAMNQQPIAPEVIGLEFEYFDGSQWLTEWDSVQNQGLPIAVQVALSIDRSRLTTKKSSSSWLSPSRSGNDSLQQPNIYRLVVYLPGSHPVSSGGSMGQGSSDAGSSGSSASGATGGSGTSGGSSTTGGSGGSGSPGGGK